VVGGVARGDLGSEPNAAVLVVFVVPEGGMRGGVVGVPVGVLVAGGGACLGLCRCGVWHTNTVNIFVIAIIERKLVSYEVDSSIKVLEAFSF
jgi:hypothetical protein